MADLPFSNFHAMGWKNQRATGIRSSAPAGGIDCERRARWVERAPQGQGTGRIVLAAIVWI
jgi:hypothetical protein